MFTPEEFETFQKVYSELLFRREMQQFGIELPPTEPEEIEDCETPHQQPKQPRKTFPDLPVGAIHDRQFVLEYAGVKKWETLNSHIIAGYFPGPIDDEATQWRAEHLNCWQIWRAEKPSRSSYQQWMHTENDEFELPEDM